MPSHRYSSSSSFAMFDNGSTASDRVTRAVERYQPATPEAMASTTSPEIQIARRRVTVTVSTLSESGSGAAPGSTPAAVPSSVARTSLARAERCFGSLTRQPAIAVRTSCGT